MQVVETSNEVEIVFERAVSLFRAAIGGVAAKEVYEGRLTQERADDWVAESVSLFRKHLAD